MTTPSKPAVWQALVLLFVWGCTAASVAKAETESKWHRNPLLRPVEPGWSGVSVLLECHFMDGFHDSVCPSSRGAAAAANAAIDAVEAVRDTSLTALFANKSSEQTAIRVRFPTETGAAAPAGVAEREAFAEPLEAAAALVAARWAGAASQQEVILRSLMAYACNNSSPDAVMRADGAAPSATAEQLLSPPSASLRRWCVPAPLVGPFHAEQIAAIGGFQGAVSRGLALTPPAVGCVGLAAGLEAAGAALDRAAAAVPALLKALSDLRARLTAAMRRSTVFQGVLPLLEASGRRPLYQVTRDKRATGRRLARSAVVTRTAWCLGLQPGVEDGATLPLGELPDALRAALGLPAMRARPGHWSAILPGSPRIPASGCPKLPALRHWASPTADGRWFDASEAWWRRLPDTLPGRMVRSLAPLAVPSTASAVNVSVGLGVVSSGVLESRWAMSGANWAFMREPGAEGFGFKLSDGEGLELEEHGSDVVRLDADLDERDTALRPEQVRADAATAEVSPAEADAVLLAQAVRVVSALPQHATICDAVEVLARAHALGAAARGPLVGADEAEGAFHYADVRPPPGAVAACDAVDALEHAEFLATATYRAGVRAATGLVSLAGELWREAVSARRHVESGRFLPTERRQDAAAAEAGQDGSAAEVGSAGEGSVSLSTDLEAEVEAWTRTLLEDATNGSEGIRQQTRAGKVTGVTGLDRGELQCHALLRDTGEQWTSAMNTALRSANVARRLLQVGEGWDLAARHTSTDAKATTHDGFAAAVMAEAMQRWGVAK